MLFFFNKDDINLVIKCSFFVFLIPKYLIFKYLGIFLC